MSCFQVLKTASGRPELRFYGLFTLSQHPQGKAEAEGEKIAPAEMVPLKDILPLSFHCHV